MGCLSASPRSTSLALRQDDLAHLHRRPQRRTTLTLLALSDDVSSAHDRADFKPAMEAFAEVQRDVKNKYAYADSSLLTSGGYQFDPYYN